MPLVLGHRSHGGYLPLDSLFTEISVSGTRHTCESSGIGLYDTHLTLRVEREVLIAYSSHMEIYVHSAKAFHQFSKLTHGFRLRYVYRSILHKNQDTCFSGL